jgi:hypothetical protein
MGRSGPFFSDFLPHSSAMRLQIRQKLSSLERILAFDAPSPAASYADGTTLRLNTKRSGWDDAGAKA